MKNRKTDRTGTWASMGVMGFYNMMHAIIINYYNEYYINYIINEDFKLEKAPTDKVKEPDSGGSDQQNLGYKYAILSMYLIYSYNLFCLLGLVCLPIGFVLTVVFNCILLPFVLVI